MTYAEQLKHPKWQKRRLEVLARDEFFCQFCGAQDMQLHVHHLVYLKNKNLWDYPDHLLKSLCSVCHEEVEETKHMVCIGLAQSHPWMRCFQALSALTMLEKPRPLNLQEVEAVESFLERTFYHADELAKLDSILRYFQKFASKREAGGAAKKTENA